MRRLVVTFTCALLVAACSEADPAPVDDQSTAQSSGAISLDWLDRFGTGELDAARDVVVDEESVYVAGSTEGTLDGQQSVGGVDGFLRKYNPHGDLIWTTQFGNKDEDQVFGVAVDEGQVYVAGTSEFPHSEGSDVLRNDAVVRAFDADGQLLWTDQIGAPGVFPFTNTAATSATAADGRVYVAGFERQRVGRFDQYRGWVRAYGSDGGLLWHQDVASLNEDIEIQGDVLYVVGHRPVTIGALLPGWVATIARLTADGEVVWEQSFDLEDENADRPVGQDAAFGVAIGDDDEAYVVGSGHLFELINGTRAPVEHHFIRRFDPDGQEAWTRLSPTPLEGVVFRDGALYASGDAVTNYDFALLGMFQRVEGGVSVRRYDTDGTFEASFEVVDEEVGDFGGVAAHPRAIYVAGAFVDIAGGDLATTTADAFLARLTDQRDGEPPVDDCATVDGDVIIDGPADLQQFTDIAGCFEITGGLYIQDTAGIESLEALGGLRSVGEYVAVTDNQDLVDLAGLEDLETIGAGLVIANNDQLQTATSFDALRVIDGPLHIFRNFALTEVDLPMLESVHRPAEARYAALILSANDALVEARLNSLELIGGFATVENNDVLSVLEMDALTRVAGRLRIAYNFALPTCAVEALVDGVSVAGSLVIEGNDDEMVCP